MSKTKTRVAQQVEPASISPSRNHVADLLITLWSLALGAIVTQWWFYRTPGNGPLGLDLLGLGQIFGLVATYLALTLMLLIARIRPLERAVGFDRMLNWHRKVAPWVLLGLVVHAFTLTLAYASPNQGFFSSIASMVTTYDWMLAAWVGFALLVGVSLSSVPHIRKWMSYETWHATHLYVYLAIALSAMHQVFLGSLIPSHSDMRYLWLFLYVGSFVIVAAYRVALPVVRSLRHDLRVDKVVREGDGTVSIYLKGRDLGDLPAYGGQFFIWRFLVPGLMFQGHPYSLSAAPGRNHLRITVKNLGDHSASLARIHKGTRVFFEGPYGGFDPEAINANRLVLVGAGVGVAPLRALLEHIPAGRDVDFIARYSKVEEELFVSELTAICKKKNVRLHVLTGPRTQYPLNAPQLKNALPRMSRARVFICGSGAFGEHLREEFLHVGVDPDNIHTEAFAFLPGRSPSSNRSSIPLRSQIETPGSKLEVSSS